MNDLINEEEFIKSKFYNPWRRFIFFYVLAILNIATIYATATYFENNIITAIIIISMVLLFFTMPFIMIFHNKQIKYSSKKAIVSGIIILLLIYFFANIFLEILDNGLFIVLHLNYIFHFIVLSCLIGYALLCSGIIILIINRKRKKHAKLT
ncbi:hypothetical protein [Flavobacterium beibuense]|uniref:hypothetical protein n=1 Tax=Flavobacterium beibuense TaxID=657326 RepID=UPI003A8F5AE9